jgi:paraquat-inducible protein B
MTGEELPRARVRRKRSWLLHAFWIVPVAALAVAGWLVAKHLRAYGPEVTIEFRDGSGLRPGQTPVKFRGIYVGEVTRIDLAEDHEHVLVHARLKRDAASLAKEGARFWIVRPQVGWGNVTGLGTVISGPEIQLLEGKGEPTRRFKGLEHAPVTAQGQPGLDFVLKAERPVSLRPGSPLYYRGVEVGTVQQIDLSPDSRAADIHVTVYQRFAALVRTGSAFWNVSGISLHGGLLKGIQLEIDSLRTIVAGGIEFASPEGSPPAKPGAAFFLNASPRKEWLGWNPKIRIPPEEGG